APGAALQAWWSFQGGGQIQETAGGRLLATFGRGPAYVSALAFSADGKSLAGAAGVVLVWEAATGKELHRLAGHGTARVAALAFAPTGRLLASAGQDKSPRVWDLSTGQPIACFEGHQAEVSCLAFSPAGRRLASASADGTVLVWKVAPGASPGAR